MRLKRFGLAMVAAAMLAAIVAGSASAAAVTPTTTHWIINGTKMATGGSETVKCEVGKHLFGSTREAKLELTGTLGEAATAVKLTATGIECISSTGTEAKNGTATINQTETMAEDRGRFRFTGVTVDEPANCQVKGSKDAAAGTVTTEPLKSSIVEETSPATVFDKFEPETGTTFVTLEISKSGTPACAVSGTYQAKGVAYGEAVKNVEGTEAAPTGYEASPQALTVSGAIETTAGGTLKLGGNPATLTGRVLNTLTGTNAGVKFGAVE